MISDYIIDGTVYCKRCAWRRIATRMKDGTIVPDLGHYTEVRVEMEEPDGQTSLHESCMCLPCAQELREDELPALWEADLGAWARERALASPKHIPSLGAWLIAQALRKPRHLVGICWPPE